MARHNNSGAAPVPVETAFLPEEKALLPMVDDERLERAMVEHMERRIGRNPRALRIHVQRILLLHRERDATGCFDALVDLFIILGPRGRELRANLVQQCSDLLDKRELEFLRRHLDDGIDAATALPETASSLLTLGVSGSANLLEGKPASPDNLLKQALTAIKHGDEKTAQRYLERALEIDPGHELVSMELLALYRRNGLRTDFLNTWTRLSSRKLALPEMWEALDRRFAAWPRPRKAPNKKRKPQESRMSDQTPLQRYYLLPSPAGAFYAISSPQPDAMRRLLLALMTETVTPKIVLSDLAQKIGADSERDVLELLHQAQTLAWIQGFAEPQRIPGQHVARAMKRLLAPLSAIGKGLLVDWNGFAFASNGIDDETASVLSALATDIAAVERRHADRLRQTLGVSSQGWAAVDAYGASRIGAWPLFVSEHRFLIVLQGEPRLNQPEFVKLVWLLVSRYGGRALE